MALHYKNGALSYKNSKMEHEMTIDQLIEQASALLDEADEKGALKCLESALKQGDTTELRLLVAEAYMNLDQVAAARKSLDAGLLLDGNDPDLLIALGDLNLEEGCNNAAIDCYQRVIDADPDDIDARVSLAMAYANDNQIELAESCCRQAIERDAQSSFALNALGEILLKHGKNDAAKTCFEQACEADPEDAQGFLNLADMLYEEEDLENAKELCVKALTLDPAIAAGYLTLGNICLDQDQAGEAVEHYEQFLRIETSPGAKQIRDEVNAVLEGLR